MSNAMSSAGADCVITLVEITSATGVGVGAHVLEGDAARHLHQESRRRERRTSVTQARTSSGVMLSSSTMLGAGRDRFLDLRRCGRTRPRPCAPATARAPRTASVMPMPARWLSFTSTKSDSEPRWFTPPPARTAAFSSARSPGSVLRVSQTRAGRRRPRTKRRVAVATPERWQRKLSAVRSPVSTDRERPAHRTELGAGADRVAVVDEPIAPAREGRAVRRPRSRTPCRR